MDIGNGKCSVIVRCVAIYMHLQINTLLIERSCTACGILLLCLSC